MGSGAPFYVTCGSILFEKIMQPKRAIVWGSGVIKENEKVRQPLQIMAVRGKITQRVLQRSGIECPDVYGDPGLLLPLVYTPKTTKNKTLVGLIPHYVDYENIRQLYQNNNNILVIDMCAPIESVVDEITMCSCTLSSSLHGIIISHAYNVPSAWCQSVSPLSGDGCKFKDHYSLFYQEYDYLQPLQKMNEYKDFKEISDAVLEYPQPKTPIDVKNLYNNCPFKPSGIQKSEKTVYVVHGKHPCQCALAQLMCDVLQKINFAALSIENTRLKESDFGSSKCLFIVVGRTEISPKCEPFVLWQLDQPFSSDKKQILKARRAMKVWDFTIFGTQLWKSLGTNAIYVPFPTLGPVQPRISFEKRKYDVTLIGTFNEKRTKIMNKLKQCGMKIFYSQNCFGSQKKEVLSHSKIVLNLHYYEKSAQEINRVLEAYEHGAYVLCEKSIIDNETEMLLNGESITFFDSLDEVDKLFSSLRIEIEKILSKLSNSTSVYTIRKSQKEILKRFQDETCSTLEKQVNFYFSEI